jgi:hypothetical protein
MGMLFGGAFAPFFRLRNVGGAWALPFFLSNAKKLPLYYDNFSLFLQVAT